MATTLKLRLDAGPANEMLSALSQAAERLPEFGDALLGLLDSGEELFLLHRHNTPASRAGEVVMRLDPGHSLLRLVAAFRARQPELLFFEHFPLQVDVEHSNIVAQVVQ